MWKWRSYTLAYKEKGCAALKKIIIILEAGTRTQKGARPRGRNPETKRRRNPKDPGPRTETGRLASRQKANDRRKARRRDERTGRRAGRQASGGEEERDALADNQGRIDRIQHHATHMKEKRRTDG